MGGGRIIWRIGGLDAAFDTERAAWVSLRGVDDADGTEFLITPDEFPGFDGPDARWLGDLTIVVRDEAAAYEGNAAYDVADAHVDATFPDRHASQSSPHTNARAIHTAAFDRRAVDYPDASTIDVRIAAGDDTNGLSIAEQFRKRDDDIAWTVELSNDGDKPVVIERLGVPLLMNQFFRGDDEFKYRQCVLRHMCLTGMHTWAYWQKSSGDMPLLLVSLTGGTAAHSFTVDHDRRWQQGGGAGSTFEGVYELNLVDRPTDEFPSATGPLTLAAGERRKFTMAIAMRGSYDEAWDWLAGIGGFMLDAEPGMVAPVGSAIDLTIRSVGRPQLEAMCDGDIVSDAEPIDAISPAGDDSDAADRAALRLWRASVTLGGYGRRAFHVKLDADRTIAGRDHDDVAIVTFFGIEPPEDIYRKQNAFIAQRQWETDPDDPCYHGLLMWDMTNRRRINASFNPDLPNWMAGGSDEIGLVSGLLLSEWNVYRPDETQLRVLDGYCRDFIEARLTEQPGYKVHRMVPWFEMFDPWTERGVDDVWRAFNYVHVANTFLNMYRIAKRYGGLYPWLNAPQYWLERAFRYFTAMFDYWMFPDGEGADRYANMGESVLAMHLSDALRAEGLDDDAARVEGLVYKKGLYFAGKTYPYGSEMAYDSTAYEAVYGYGAAIGDERVMSSAMRVALANRGRQPDWALHMTDLRGCGDSGWNISYMTQLGAWTMADWALERRHYDADVLQALASSYLAGFAIYNSGGYLSADPANEGASAWIHVVETGSLTGVRAGSPDGSGSQRMIRGFVPYSGESALGYFGALRSAASFVMRDAVGGTALRICGGVLAGGESTVVAQDDGYAVRPTDGLRARFYDTVHDWAITLDRDALHEIDAEPAAVLADSGDERRLGAIRIVIDNVTGDAHDCTVRLRMPSDGEYHLSVAYADDRDGRVLDARSARVDERLGTDWTTVTIPVDGERTTVRIVAAD